MAGSPSTLDTRFTANIVQFENELRRLQRLNQRAAANVAAAHQRAAAQSNSAWANSNIGGAINRSMASIGPMLKQYAGLIAGMFAGREAYNAVETYSRFANSLKVAGLEGAALDSVQRSLYDAAIKNGVALEPLGQLYSKVSQSAKELGANQSSMIKFTNGVTSALRVAGTSTGEASGALMQLSQLLASGTVHAEEFNSVNEGARPILEAVAKGSDKYGGSVSKLRAEVLKGKVSSKDFFDAFLAGSASLESQAAKAPLTVAASMTNLQTALTRYIGEANESWGITDKVTYAIKMMAENFDVLAKSVAIVGTVYAATFIPALSRSAAALAVGTVATVRSTVATVADTIALIARTSSLYGVSTASATATVATRALSGAMAFFGGPLGIAIMGIGAAVAYLGVSSAKAALETSALKSSVESSYKAMMSAEQAATKKRVETGNLTEAERKGAFQTAALTGEVHKLKDAYYLAAAAAKTLALANARANAQKSMADKSRAREGYDAAVEEERSRMRRSNMPAERGLSRDIPLTPAQERAARQNAFRSEAGQLWGKSVRVAYGDAKNVETVRSQNLEEYRAASVTGGGGHAPKKTGGAGGSKSKDPSNASQDAIDAAERAYAQAVAAGAATVEERHKFALAALAADRDEQIKQIDRRAKEGDITKASAEVAKGLIEKTYLQNVENANTANRAEIAERENGIREESVALAGEALKIEADRLEGMADGTKDLRLRHRYEREALDARQRADDAAFKVAQDLLALDRKKRGYAQAEIDRLRAEAERNREGQKRNEQGALDRSQKGDDPKSVGNVIEEYAKSFGTLNEQLGSIATGAINDLTNGFVDAIMGAKNFKEAMTDMAKSVISQLIKLAIQFAVMEAIGMAFGIKGLGKASLGIATKDVGKNAMGTNFAPGGLSIVGEKGPELTYLARGSQVMPNNLLRNLSGPSDARGGDNITNITNNVNASDAVLTSWVKKEVYEGSAQAVQQSNRVVNRGLQKRGKNTLGRR